MIPSNIANNTPISEKMLFDWLSSDAVHGFVLHSLTQKNHAKKSIAEIDFLYISKRGLLCIEIKGGQSIFRESGQWYSVDRNNNKHLIKNPFLQAQGCFYSLRNYLIDIYGSASPESKATMGFAVVFPECIFTGRGNDLLTEVMFDCSQNMKDFSAFLDKCFNYWDGVVREKQSRQPQLLTDMQIKKLLDLLRGDFAVVPSMSLEMQHIDQQFLSLTEEQFDALETISLNDRIIITGGAGSGKTLLAIEIARKTIAMNKKVAFICFNRNIAESVKQILNAPDNICFAGTYHQLIGHYLPSDSSAWLNAAELAEQFLQHPCDVEKYDFLIVDEAQDLMVVAIWETMDSFLRNGMEKGKWVLFLDPHQNMFNTAENYDFAMEYLKEICSPAIIPLTINCRNTEQIGKLTTKMTKISPAKHLKILGPDVTVKSYASQKELLKLLKAELTLLLSGGCSPNDIVILSKYRIENSDLANVKSLCNLSLNNAENIHDFPVNSLNYFTIQSFKGLESKIVFLIDINGFEALKNRILNYVAMTRAQILLFVFYREDTQNELTKLMEDRSNAIRTL